MKLLKDPAVVISIFSTFVAVLTLLVQAPEYALWLTISMVFFLALLLLGNAYTLEQNTVTAKIERAEGSKNEWSKKITLFVFRHRIFLAVFLIASTLIMVSSIIINSQRGWAKEIEFPMNYQMNYVQEVTLRQITRDAKLLELFRQINPVVTYKYESSYNDATVTIRFEADGEDYPLSLKFEDSGLDKKNNYLEPAGNFTYTLDGYEYRDLPLIENHTYFLEYDNMVVRLHYFVKGSFWDSTTNTGVIYVSAITDKSRRFNGLTTP